MAIPEEDPAVKTVGRVVKTFYAIASPISAAACFYHGLKRTDSLGWAFGWSILGSMAPVVAPIYAAHIGFGVPQALSKRP